MVLVLTAAAVIMIVAAAGAAIAAAAAAGAAAPHALPHRRLKHSLVIELDPNLPRGEAKLTLGPKLTPGLALGLE
jgi:hypothetical protein